MRLGVLDIGSNTVHLLLVDAHPGARPEPYAEHKRSLPLIRYQDADGAITEEGQQELVGFVREAAAFAEEHEAEDMISFCTSAIREAANGAAVLDRVQAETRVHLSELTGDQEAAMTYFAVRRWQGWDAGSILNFDIGGGSFEIAYGQDELPSHALSLPRGAGRLTRDRLPEDPPSPKSVKKLRKHIEAQMEEAFAYFPAIKGPLCVTATSKTFRSLARLTGAAPSAAAPASARWTSTRTASCPECAWECAEMIDTPDTTATGSAASTPSPAPDPMPQDPRSSTRRWSPPRTSPPEVRRGADIPVTLSSSSVFPLGTQDVFAMAQDLGYDGVEVMVTTTAGARTRRGCRPCPSAPACGSTPSTPPRCCSPSRSGGRRGPRSATRWRWPPSWGRTPSSPTPVPVAGHVRVGVRPGHRRDHGRDRRGDRRGEHVPVAGLRA
ncbi:Ppx/GppA phosphatase family protein [Micrococcus terreus]|uniref:Ppx/GppA phosphatase family protein n=1 Tax=Micrococcus terreus TaxID=574650 RepID=A0A1I7MTA5_9MICC|nr:Ppx/GppA phosphatase family protein [Micrococcus terreus]